MKRLLPILLVLCLLLCACRGNTEETKPSDQETVPSTSQTEKTEPSEDVTEDTKPDETEGTEPSEPENINPFTGEALEEPFTARPFLVSINNSRAALPHCGLNEADIVFEMLVNERATRCLALVTDLEAVQTLGPIRSLRYNFIDLAQAYDGIVIYASGSNAVLSDLAASGVDNISALSGGNGGAFYRDQNRLNSGYAREHTLFANTTLMGVYAQNLGYSVTTEENKDYGLRFTEDGTPAGGDTANTITMSFFTGNKTTTMKYDAATGKYVYNQYGQDMVDGNTGEPNSYTNVFTLFAVNTDEGVYHIADLMGEGDGYYACGGKIVPIKWHHSEENGPITFTLVDGTPLEQGVGNSYVGIIPTGSAFSYE